jgi:Zn-dependent protease with chaperone function
VRLDTASRSFFGLVGAAFIAYQLLGFGACVLVALLAYQVAGDGPDVLAGSDAALLPALFFLAVVGAGAVLGLRSLFRQIVSSVRLARRLSALTLSLPGALREAARRAGLGRRVRLLDSDQSFSFVYGAFTPRVVVSQGLMESVSERELDAVLAHERYHVHNLDPLKVVLARALPSAFFYLPALQGLQARYVAGRELAADRGAVEACGRTPLASALLKVVRGPGWPDLSTAAAIGGPELLDVRVAQLESGREPGLGQTSRRAVALTLLAITVLAGSAAASAVGAGGLEAIARTTMPDMDLSAGGLLAAAAACILPWVGAAAAGYWALTWRARRELDTARSGAALWRTSH